MPTRIPESGCFFNVIGRNKKNPVIKLSANFINSEDNLINIHAEFS